MKKRKFILSVASIVLTLFLFAFGVYAATKTTVGIVGQVSFTLSNASVLVRGKVNGQATNNKATHQETVVDFPTVNTTDYTKSTKVPEIVNSVSQTFLDFSTPETDYVSNPNGIAAWNVGDLYFYENNLGIQDIVIEVEITNYSFYPVEISVNIFEVDDDNISVATPNGTSATLDEDGGRKIIKFVLNVKNTNEKIQEADINFGVKIEQDIEAQIPPTLEGWTAKIDSSSDGLILTKYTGSDTEVVVPKELKISQLDNSGDFATSQSGSTNSGIKLSQYASEKAFKVIGVEGAQNSPVFPSNLTSVILQKNIKLIGQYSFYNCELLKELTIPENVTTIGNYAFYNTKALEVINFDAISVDDLPENNAAFAYAGQSGNGIALTFGDNATKVPAYMFEPSRNYTSYEPKIKTVEMGYCVESVGKYAFSCVADLVNVTMKNSVKTIENYAFYNCVNLADLEGCSSIETIGAVAFSGCEKITSINFPSLKSLGGSAFAKCTQLKSVELGDDLTKIESFTFNLCSNIETVILGENLEEISHQAFADCTSISEIVIPNKVKTIGQWAFDNNSSLKNLTIGESVETIGYAAFDECKNLETINFNAINMADIERDDDIFRNAGQLSNGISVTIGDSVKKIPSYLFYYAEMNNVPNIINLTMGKNVESIGERVFCYSKFKTVTIPESVTSIGNSAFNLISSLETIYYNAVNVEGLTISSEIFKSSGDANNNGLEVIFGDSVKVVPEALFYRCWALEKITLGNNIETIKTYAFYDCGLEDTLTIPENLKTIEEHAFSESTGYLENIYFNAINMNDLDGFNGNFIDAGLYSKGVNVIFGESVTRVPARLFYMASNVLSVTIGKNVSSIGDYAFYDAYRLIEVTNLSSQLTNLELNATSNGYLTKYAKRIKTSLTDASYITFDEKYSWYEDAQNNEYYLLKYTGAIPSELPSSTPSGNNYALRYTFYNKKLSSIIISDGVVEIGDYAFCNCTKLKTITMGKNVVRIGKSAFEDCSELTEITIPNSVTLIGERAFEGCSKLTSVNIPKNVTKIEQYTFSQCSSLQSIVIENNVKEIANHAFHRCQSLQSVVLGNGVTKIGNQAFDGCTSLQSIYYNGTQSEKQAILTNIGSYNTCLTNATWYYYNQNTSETVAGNYWYYDNEGNIQTFIIT